MKYLLVVVLLAGCVLPPPIVVDLDDGRYKLTVTGGYYSEVRRQASDVCRETDQGLVEISSRLDPGKFPIKFPVHTLTFFCVPS